MASNPWSFEYPIFLNFHKNEKNVKSSQLLDDGPGALEDLPRIMPHFFIPLMEDKPQNPILDALRLEKANTSLPVRKRVPPQSTMNGLNALGGHTSRDQGNFAATASKKAEEAEDVLLLWETAIERKSRARNSLFSWDRLRSTHSSEASPTAFISEQEEFVYTSARHHVQPRLYNAKHWIVHTTQHDLFASLKSTVLGISSRLHTWDSVSERFVYIDAPASTENGNDVFPVLLVDGKDEVVSASVLKRFLRIGTLLRRLELLLVSIRTRPAKEGPTIHALAHSLSATVDYIREELVECPPSDSELADEYTPLALAGIWSHYEPYEDLLIALAEVFERNESLLPKAYLNLEPSPSPLLSRIYNHLSLHFERHSSTLIRGVLAFILTNASQEYIQDVSLSVGFGGKPKDITAKRDKTRDELIMDDDDEEQDIFDMMDEIDLAISFPTFFPEKILNLLPAAQKSLVLLRVAQPDHPLLGGAAKGRSVRWVWTAEEVESKWEDFVLPSPASTSDLGKPEATAAAPTNAVYKPELLGFEMFDLEPGTQITNQHTSRNAMLASHSNLRSFIQKFPSHLPSITPTLPSLTLLAFRDLMNHASTLSSALLSLFIEQRGMLNFCTHLKLLRSFLLVAKPGFKTRLLTALFDDAGEYGVATGGQRLTAHSLSIRALRIRKMRNKDPLLQGIEKPKESNQPWAVGLAPHLLERETWPPVGADLSFFLRTVIVDSLGGQGGIERDEVEVDDAEVEEREFAKEAEWRLGFAIKDLPQMDSKGKDRAKWLDPLAIEALDFLYMDYKPPKPLELLISPDILSKYQRMFTFILRLLRVESALKSLFRMSTHRTLSTVLFPTLTKSRQLLLHFRFVSQTFISSLSGYIFDTAIGGNFDPFLARLTVPGSSGSTSTTLAERTFELSDVFELAQAHSRLLDDILSACLLRSGQKGVGELLRQSMEFVLEFTIVVGELHRGRIPEYEAAPMVEELYGRFCVKMTTFTQVLKGLVDKSPSSTRVVLETYNGKRKPTGGLDALYHLLIRVDLTDWWSSKRSQKRD